MSVYTRLSPRGRWTFNPLTREAARPIYDTQTGAEVAVQRQRPGQTPGTALAWCELPDGRTTPDRRGVRESIEDLAALLDGEVHE